MFEHRPFDQQMLIAKIKKFPTSIVVSAQDKHGTSEGKTNMPITVSGLKCLLELCKWLSSGKSYESWQKKEKVRAEKELAGWTWNAATRRYQGFSYSQKMMGR